MGIDSRPLEALWGSLFPFLQGAILAKEVPGFDRFRFLWYPVAKRRTPLEGLKLEFSICHHPCAPPVAKRRTPLEGLKLRRGVGNGGAGGGRKEENPA